MLKEETDRGTENREIIVQVAVRPPVPAVGRAEGGPIFSQQDPAALLRRRRNYPGLWNIMICE
ncbi:isocitrate dehydrogenase [Anopheles sinensis]|uniref:Isocitrate dehydrogenase n=1 Tax=Anopheles sinensis TaxID=74873 RepID=A0A084VNS8_ANOSI|nr:isocitrate dehydrogenase [Anopheles sinensis]